MISTIFVLLLFRADDFVGYHGVTFPTLEACVDAGRTMVKHKFQCIRLEIKQP